MEYILRMYMLSSLKETYQLKVFFSASNQYFVPLIVFLVR